MPLPERYKSLGRYYQALYIKRNGNFDKACALLERVAESAPAGYRAKALMSMGTIFWQSGDSYSAWPLYSEALRAAGDKSCYDLATLFKPIAESPCSKV